MNQKVNNWLLFLIPPAILACYYYLAHGNMYLEAPDANLYMSVSENLIKNGHFIQNFYPENPDFIVPFGLPALILFLKLIVNSVYFIVFMQYILFGAACLLLFHTCRNLFHNMISGWTAVAVYLFTIMENPVCGPAYVLTENYTLFLLILLCYIISGGMAKMKTGSKIVFLNAVLFAGFVIRPLLGILFAISMAGSLVYVLVKKTALKKFLIMTGIFGFLLAANALVNFREVREPVFLENYSAYSVYQANNPNTKTTPYASAWYPDFIDDYGLSIRGSDMTMEQKDRLYTAGARKYISENLGVVLRNAAVKYYKMFVLHFDLSFYLCGVSFLVLMFAYKKRRREFCMLLGIFLLLSAVTSFGLNVSRYAIVALPFYAVFKAGLLGLAVTALVKKIKN